MIHICYVIEQLARGGAEKQVYELLKGLNKENFDPLVITFRGGGYWSGEIRKLGIPVFEIPRNNNRELGRLFSLIRILKTKKPDIVHTYLFSANTYGRVAALLSGVRVIIASERNAAELERDKNKTQLRVDKFLSLFSDAVICNTERAAEVLLKKYSFDRNKVFTIHNGIDNSGFERRSRSKADSQCKVIGTIGRLYPQKNHKLFMETAKMLLERFLERKFRFLIVGKGFLKQDLVEYARSLGLTDKVEFTDERTDIPELLRSMDIFVMTSDFEGLSNAIMEAMLSGLPVVATDVGGNGELIMDGKTGYLCPPGDAAAIADKIGELICDEEKMITMGERGRQRILSEFPMRKMIRDTENIYINILQRKNAGNVKVIDPLRK